MLPRLTFPVAVALLLPACFTHPPAKMSPAEVEVFWHEWSAVPPDGHEPILRIEKELRTPNCPGLEEPRPPEPGTELHGLVQELLHEAADLGADAVIDVHLNCRDEVLGVGRRFPRWVVSGTAVYWPDRRPREV